MKILLTSDQSPATVNGVIISSLNLMRELEKAGQDVRLLTLSPTGKSYVDGQCYYIRSVPFNIYPGVRASLAHRDPLIRELITWNPDIIHSQCEFFTYSFVRTIAARCRCPIVHTYHTMYEHYVRYVLPVGNGSGLVAPVMRSRLYDCDVIIAPSAKARNSLRRGHVGDDVRIIPTGIDLQKYEQRISEVRKQELLTALDVPADVPRFGSVGRLAKEKNYSELLCALRAVIDSGRHCMLILTGDGAYRKNLEEETDRLGLRPYVRFAGMIPAERIYEAYQLLDVFLSASISETQGLTYIEALANDLPVLARKDLALDGVVEDGANGYCYTTTDELVKHWNALLDKPEQRQTLAEGAHASRERFGTRLFGERVLHLYREVLQREGPTKFQQARLLYRLQAMSKAQLQKSDCGRLAERFFAQRARLRFRTRKNDHADA